MSQWHDIAYALSLGDAIIIVIKLSSISNYLLYSQTMLSKIES